MDHKQFEVSGAIYAEPLIYDGMVLVVTEEDASATR